MEEYVCLDLNKSKHYKKRKLEFDYLTYKMLSKQNNFNIVGMCDVDGKSLKYDDKKDIKVIAFECKDETFRYPIQLNIEDEKDERVKEKKRNSFGYVHIGNGNYVAVKDIGAAAIPFWIIPLILLVVILTYVLCIKFGLVKTETRTEQNTKGLDIADGSEYNGENVNNTPSINDIAGTTVIPGYSAVYVSEQSKNVMLVNPEDNTVYFVYQIFEGDNLLIETKAIEPGKMLEEDLYSLIDEGEHELTFNILTYDVETEQSCNGAVTTVRVIKE